MSSSRQADENRQGAKTDENRREPTRGKEFECGMWSAECGMGKDRGEEKIQDAQYKIYDRSFLLSADVPRFKHSRAGSDDHRKNKSRV